jgi:Family of unknown function (DUF5309)
MAVVANTFRTTNAVGNREELADVVSRITPEDTPLYTMAGKEKAKSIHPEWEIDTLRAPGANAQEEGDDYTFNAVIAPSRVGNYTQIFRESWIISGTQEVVDEAGNVQKRKYQKLKKGVEVRKDVEFALVSNTASVAGATRNLGSLPSWITSNVSRGSGGANGGFSQGTGLTVAATNGTQRAFTKAIMDAVAQAGFNSGANFSDLVVSPYVKSVFVTFMSDANVANFRYDIPSGEKGSKHTIIGTADIYEGPFGKLAVRPNRVMAASAAVARNAFFVDTEYMAMKTLRPIQEDPDVAKTGDADKGVIIGEVTLAVKNEAGLGVAADLFGLTAST